MLHPYELQPKSIKFNSIWQAELVVLFFCFFSCFVLQKYDAVVCVLLLFSFFGRETHHSRTVSKQQ